MTISLTSAKGLDGWVQKIAIFADLQHYCTYAEIVVGGSKKSKNMLTWYRWTPIFFINNLVLEKFWYIVSSQGQYSWGRPLITSLTFRWNSQKVIKVVWKGRGQNVGWRGALYGSFDVPHRADSDIIYGQALTSIHHHSMKRTMEHSIKINVV